MENSQMMPNLGKTDRMNKAGFGFGIATGQV
jgi:hypothetical protein